LSAERKAAAKRTSKATAKRTKVAAKPTSEATPKRTKVAAKPTSEATPNRTSKAAAKPTSEATRNRTKVAAKPGGEAPAEPAKVAASPTNGATPRPTSKSAAKRNSDTPALAATNYPLVERILVTFVREEVTRVGLDRVVLGLSGGVDSACAAAIAARALGAKHVLGVNMPYRASSPSSARDALSVAQALNIEIKAIDISAQIDAYFDHASDASKERRGNKMARERMTILYDLSAAERALVLGTSNKTELLLGYGTLFGDMASALNPLGDLYKTQVWGLAEHLGVPAPIVEKAPSADLWEGQTDEHELGFGYAEVDAILYRMVDERWSHAELVAAGFDADLAARVRSIVQRSQFKRRLPVIAKVSERTIDADFRYPRDWGT
jgi:NAD+ synthase